MLCVNKSLLVKANSIPLSKAEVGKEIKFESVSNVASGIKFFIMMPRFVNTCEEIHLDKLARLTVIWIWIHEKGDGNAI